MYNKRAFALVAVTYGVLVSGTDHDVCMGDAKDEETRILEGILGLSYDFEEGITSFRVRDYFSQLTEVGELDIAEAELEGVDLVGEKEMKCQTATEKELDGQCQNTRFLTRTAFLPSDC